MRMLSLAERKRGKTRAIRWTAEKEKNKKAKVFYSTFAFFVRYSRIKYLVVQFQFTQKFLKTRLVAQDIETRIDAGENQPPRTLGGGDFEML